MLWPVSCGASPSITQTTPNPTTQGIDMRFNDRYNISIPFLDRKSIHMPTLTVSPKYQVVIPKQIRESLQLQPGQKIHATLFEGRIELIPLQPMPQMRGFLPGLDPTITREDDRS